MDFLELAKQRYSCKSYSGAQVDDDTLGYILEAARVAPTAKNSQPYRIYVVRSEKGLAAIDKVTPCRYGAPTALVFTYRGAEAYTYPGGKYSSGAEDVSIVATHAMLAAAQKGVCSCWVNCVDPDALKAALSLPEDETAVLILDLGYAGERGGPLPNHTNKKAQTELVRYI